MITEFEFRFVCEFVRHLDGGRVLKSPKEVARWLSIIPRLSPYNGAPLDCPWSWYWYTTTTALLAPKLVSLLLVLKYEEIGKLESFGVIIVVNSWDWIRMYNSHLLQYIKISCFFIATCVAEYGEQMSSAMWHIAGFWTGCLGVQRWCVGRTVTTRSHQAPHVGDDKRTLHCHHILGGHYRYDILLYS